MAEAWLGQLTPSESGKLLFSPAVFHAGSLLLHLACVVLVYRLLLMMTEYSALSTQYSVPSVANRPACLGALLFALHPLQVESVAWVSEQRGLLSALFSLLCLMAWLKFGAGVPGAATKGIGYYFLASAACLMALLAKPSAVSLPLMAIVLDVFLLRRAWRVSVLALLPWAAMVAMIVFITRQEQSHLHLTFVAPLWARPLVAGDALQFYLNKLVWPRSLGILYQRSPEHAMAQVWFYWTWLVPAVVVALIAWSRHRAAFVAVGWFVAVLLPVLGLIPFAHQAYSTVADRYMYLAMAAPAYGLACWVAAGASRWKLAVCGAILLLCGVLSFQQAGHWRDSVTLYMQALRVNPDSASAHSNLGRELLMRGDLESAERHLHLALKLDPSSAMANFHQGILLAQQGKTEAARQCYERAIELDGEYAPPQVNLGVLLMNEGRNEEALAAFAAALRIDPLELRAHFNRGLVYERMGQPAAAIEEFGQVIEHAPANHASRLKLGMLLVSQGQRREAMEHFRAILSKQDDPSAHAELAAALVEEGDPHTALQHYGQALRQASPVWPAIAGRAAWLLSTYPAEDVRNGRQAVLLAEEACRQTDYQSSQLLQSLAAAKAEVGDFREAAARAGQAHQRALAAGDSQRAAALEEQLRSYREERPFRTSPRVTTSGNEDE